MGKTITPKYKVLVTEPVYVNGQFRGSRTNTMSWDCKRYGRPTSENVKKYAITLGKSYEIGGVNEHISKACGAIPYPSSATVAYNYAGGATVAEWTAPMFMVW